MLEPPNQACISGRISKSFLSFDIPKRCFPIDCPLADCVQKSGKMRGKKMSSLWPLGAVTLVCTADQAPGSKVRYGSSLMRKLVLLAILAAGLGNPTSSAAQNCACGPLYCQNDPNFPAALQAKKSRMTADGYPAQFVSLLDKAGKCRVCVNNSPDIFTILVVEPNGDNRTVPWDADNERIAKDQIKSGAIASYYVYNARKACTCCGEPKAEERSDYDSNLELNRATAIKCVKSGNSVACQ
jgi:hypothetical protein